MARRRSPQEYTPEEFDAVVALIRSDRGLQADIEQITGQKLAGKTARELFDLFRAIETAAHVQTAVVAYGRARLMVRDTRTMLAEAELEDREPTDLAVRRIRELETTVDELKAVNGRLKETNRKLMGGKPVSVIKGQVSA
jgi:hypothetical protein